MPGESRIEGIIRKQETEKAERVLPREVRERQEPKQANLITAFKEAADVLSDDEAMRKLAENPRFFTKDWFHNNKIKAKFILKAAGLGVQKFLEQEQDNIKADWRGIKEKTAGAKKEAGEVWTEEKEKKKRGLSPEEKRKRKIMIAGMILLGVGVVGCLINAYGAGLLIHHNDGNKGGTGNENPTPTLKPEYKPYFDAAQGELAKYRQQGPIIGHMLDPMAIDDSETRLITAFIPGWFCQPEQIKICQEMLGVDLHSYGLTDSKADQLLFFSKMTQDWDQKWLPLLEANPNLSQAVKDFYKPENRDFLKQWYLDHFPSKSPAFLNQQRTVADNMFARFLETGKLIPRNFSMLTYSHLAGAFVANLYEGAMMIQMPFFKNGFIPAPEVTSPGFYPAQVREAMAKMEKITKRDDYTLSEIEPYWRVINTFYAEEEEKVEKREGLVNKPGALLGRI
ncbi:MAG: hypothetical protein NTZ93_04190 [Candidatus Beckwithbacteria bacterium]|nr:hypothetical protein [Candidatus Beckwithbacteria bacterium]